MSHRPSGRARRLLVVVLLVPAVLGIGAGDAAAADLKDKGWWNRLNTGSPLPAPTPPVPEGGLRVGGGLDGPTAVAAVRFAVAEGEASSTLTLEIATETGGDEAVLLACANDRKWTPVENGPFPARPKDLCDQGNAVGKREGMSFTFEVGQLVDDGVLDVVLVPGKAEGGGFGSTFELAFAPPTSASLGAASASPDISDSSGFPSGGPAPSDSPPPSDPGTSPAAPTDTVPPSDPGFTPSAPSDPGTVSDPGTSGSTFEPAPLDGGTGAGSTFTPPPASGATLPSAEPSAGTGFTTTPPLADPTTAVTVADPGVAAPVAPAPAGAPVAGTDEVALDGATPASTSSTRSPRVLGFVVLLLCALAAAVAGFPDLRSKVFGRGADLATVSADAGLGRFIRPRIGPAPQI